MVEKWHCIVLYFRWTPDHPLVWCLPQKVLSVKPWLHSSDYHKHSATTGVVFAIELWLHWKQLLVQSGIQSALVFNPNCPPEVPCVPKGAI